MNQFSQQLSNLASSFQFNKVSSIFLFFSATAGWHQQSFNCDASSFQVWTKKIHLEVFSQVAVGEQTVYELNQYSSQVF